LQITDAGRKNKEEERTREDKEGREQMDGLWLRQREGVKGKNKKRRRRKYREEGEQPKDFQFRKKGER